MNLVIIFTSGANYNDGGIGPGAYRLNDLSAIHIFDGVVNQIKNHLNDQLRINVCKDKVFAAAHTNGVFFTLSVDVLQRFRNDLIHEFDTMT